jgi:hypothetical protein
MEGIDKPHTGKYKEITNDSNYDVSCTLTSLPVWDLENFKRFIFVVQCTTANSCISGRRNFIIFLYFIHLQRKLNSLKRYDIAQNYIILHRVVQRLSQHNLKISHHRHI